MYPVEHINAVATAVAKLLNKAERYYVRQYLTSVCGWSEETAKEILDRAESINEMRGKKDV